MGAFSPTRLRAVTHCYVERAEIEEVLQVLAHSMANDAIAKNDHPISTSPYFQKN
jgi:hypothetical protein